jgi:HD superfamily phosphohydrolase
VVLDKKYTVRDPVHGFIHFTEQERQLIDSKPFQRLRNLKQLATAYLVYPGAVHTRFDHSLGVMHVAGRIAKHLAETQKDRLNAVGEDPEELEKKVRLAALCHDLGHGPFCHVSEPVIKHVCTSTNGDNEKIHEIITCKIIAESEEIRRVLGNDFKDILEIIEGKIIEKRESRFLAKEIISGSLDADKMDYLLRDSYFAGVKYGVFDIEKVIQSLIVMPDRPEVFLGIKEEGLRALEQMILAKFFIGEQVYYHKTRAAGDVLIQRALNEAVKEEITNKYENWLVDAFSVNNDNWNLCDYLDLYDQKVIDILVKRNNLSGTLMNFLKHRQLPRLRFHVSLTPPYLNAFVRKNLSGKLPNDPDFVSDKELEIAESLGYKHEPYRIFIRLSETKYPAIGDKRNQINPEDIMYEDKKGNPQFLADYPESVINYKTEFKKKQSEVVQIFILFPNQDEIDNYDNKKDLFDKQFLSILSS